MQSDSRTLLTNAGSSSSSSNGKPDRLYVGNLSPSVDEYTLIQVFQKYGQITKLDFMFHKTGVLKGKPRGYAFVEFSNKDDALKAMVKLHDRLLRGRKLVVTSASSATSNDVPLYTNKGRRSEPAKTTTLSLLKQSRRPQSAAAQIAAMEAKLANLQSRKPADEDYVPGLGIDSNFNAPRRDGSVSASLPASGATTPADLEKDLDEEMGLDAATKAADELEKEFGLEIAGRQVSVDSERERSRERTGSVDHHTTREGSAPIGREERSPVKEPREEEKRKQQLYQKGLASLPKKPSFL